MFDNWLEVIDKHCAEFVYEMEPAIVFVAGIIISIVMWLINPEKMKRSKAYFIIVAILLLSCLVSGYIIHVNRTYTRVPDVNFGQHSLSIVQEQLVVEGLYVNDEDIVLDAKAQKRQAEEDLNSYYYKVTEITPEIGAFIRKGEHVILHLTWKNVFNSASVELPETSDFVAKEYYGDVKTQSLYPFNANSFKLFTSEAAGKMVSEYIDDHWFGVHPLTDHAFTASLINYKTGEIIQVKEGIVGDTVEFTEIPDGIYYYLVESEGYQQAVPSSPFLLEYDPSKPLSILPWSVELIAEGSTSSEAMSVTIMDTQGAPIPNAEVEIRAVSNDDMLPSSFSYYTVMTDEAGRICQRYWINDVEHIDSAMLQAFDGYSWEMRLVGQKEFIPIDYSYDVGICVIPTD